MMSRAQGFTKMYSKGHDQHRAMVFPFSTVRLNVLSSFCNTGSFSTIVTANLIGSGVGFLK